MSWSLSKIIVKQWGVHLAASTVRLVWAEPLVFLFTPHNHYRRRHITTNDDDYANFCKSLRAHGWLRGLDQNARPANLASPDAFRDMFWFVVPGFNVRPIEFTGAIGLEQLEKFDSFMQLRTQNLNHFHQKITLQNTFIHKR